MGDFKTMICGSVSTVEEFFLDLDNSDWKTEIMSNNLHALDSKRGVDTMG